MAEGAVTFSSQKLRQLLEYEVHLPARVRDEVILLRDKLQWLRSFLKDADEKLREDEGGVKLWVTQIRDVAYEAEDIIDEFVIRIDQQHNRRDGYVGFMRKLCWEINRRRALHGLGQKIKIINTRIDDMYVRKTQDDIKSIQDGGESSISYKREKKAPKVEEFDVVGIEDEAKVIAKLLIEGEARRSVISITGMGGLGKTTLAKIVYNRDDVKGYFDCFGWINVSQEFSVRGLLYDVVKCFLKLKRDEIKMMENMNEEELRYKLFKYLQGKRYLVVFDDIWSIEAWRGLEHSFPDERNGSRIIFTTRNKFVALGADPMSLLHELRFLSEEECWELFRKKAFPKDLGHCCPSDLENVGREIVGRCGGLPLAVVVLGGLLSRKEQSVGEWRKVLNSTIHHSNEAEDQISRILAASYYDLPYYLKQCFLQFGAFPDDSEIRATELIRLWIAEGFVLGRGDEIMEDIAEDWLLELIRRNLIQPVNTSSNGRVKKCRIHDLLRDLILKEAKEGNFLHVYGENAYSASSTTARRLTITPHDISMYISLNGSNRHLRSLYCFSQSVEMFEKAHWKCIYEGFKLLRVMHMDGINISVLPDGIGDLVYLRFLSISVTTPTRTSLPSTISNLYNLQTLCIRNGEVCSIPDDIWKLKRLRHLQLDNGIFPPDAKHVQLNKLTNLQTLSKMRVGDWIMDDLSNLSSLRSLGLHGELISYRTALFDFIGKQEKLKSLCLEAAEDFLIPIHVSHLQHLEKLCLFGRLEMLPALQDWPPNLTKLVLIRSRLPKDPMFILEKLPNLQHLKLQYGSYSGKIMSCSAGGFPKLRVLEMSWLSGLNRWIVEEGALVNLRRLEINHCENLEMIPEGLLHVNTLQELVLSRQAPHFLERVEENGEDWFKIQHVPSVVIVR